MYMYVNVQLNQCGLFKTTSHFTGCFTFSVLRKFQLAVLLAVLLVVLLAVFLKETPLDPLANLDPYAVDSDLESESQKVQKG